ncbi:hypothetical protein Tco_0794949 [Tanacetum coccineum]
MPDDMVQQGMDDDASIIVYEEVGDKEVVDHMGEPVDHEEVKEGWLMKLRPRKRKRANQDKSAFGYVPIGSARKKRRLDENKSPRKAIHDYVEE